MRNEVCGKEKKPARIYPLQNIVLPCTSVEWVGRRFRDFHFLNVQKRPGDCPKSHHESE